MEAVCTSAARAWPRSAKESQPFRDSRSTRPMNGVPRQRFSGCVRDMAWEVGTMDEVQTKRSVIQRKTAEFRWELSNAIDCDLGWLKDGDFRVLRVICKYADVHGIAYPSQRTMALACGCGQSTVSKRVKRLTRLGLIRISRRGCFRTKTATRYQIIPIKEWTMDRVFDVYGRHHKLPALQPPIPPEFKEQIP